MKVENQPSVAISKLSIDQKTKQLTADVVVTTTLENGTPYNEKQPGKEGDRPVHPDLWNEMRLLVPHMLMRCGVPGYKSFSADYLKKKKALTDEAIQDYYVSGFSVTSKGLINIIGGLKNEQGQVTSMVAPITSLDVDTSQYAYARELAVTVENIIEHGRDYFLSHKFGESAQTEISLTTPNE